MKRGVGGGGICGINLDAAVAYKTPGSPVPIPPPTPGPPPGLPCNCTQSCEATCNNFGMICCGNGQDCDCMPQASCPKCAPTGAWKDQLVV